jgi:hypothetical protein
MCSSKKSIIGHFVVCRTSRISSVAAVVNAIGVTGPSAARVEDLDHATSLLRRGDEREQPTLEPQLRNWINSALPIVSALMPVLSDRKKTGVAGVPRATSTSVMG